VAIRNHLESLWKSQVTADELLDEQAKPSPDTIGGFRLDTDIVPEPTWLTAGPLAAASSALTVDRFVAVQDRPAWLLNCATGMRFLYQLTMTPDATWYVHDLPASVGGMRTAFWDNRQPLAATAMALLAAAELQHAVGQLNNRD